MLVPLTLVQAQLVRVVLAGALHRGAETVAGLWIRQHVQFDELSLQRHESASTLLYD